MASEKNFPDALSISSIAAYKGYPILITPQSSLIAT
ncbi:cell wall-binding repeat-containing protein [Clostridium ragsdalei]|nr:cell wall-binding repeat-containing protein [Clostridium ragsdalei]